MGLIVGRWDFDEAVTPTPEQIIAKFKERTGLNIVSAELGAEFWVKLPQLNDFLGNWVIEGTSISVSSGMPVNPYLWAQLGTCMQMYGGTPADGVPFCGRSDITQGCLQSAWDELTGLQKLIFAHGVIAGWRPLDWLLS